MSDNLASFGSIADLLNLRNNRRQSRRDRLMQGASLAGQRIFQGAENEAQRSHESWQNELDRESQLEIQEAADTAALERANVQETGATQRSEIAERGATGRQKMVLASTAEQNELNRAADAALAAAGDEQAMARLQEEYGLRAEENERNDERYRDYYPEGKHTYFDPVSQQTYTWGTNQEYDLAKQSMLANQDRMMARLEAELRKDPENTRDVSQFLADYQALRDHTMRSYGTVWDGQNWLGVPDDAMRERMVAEFDKLVTGSVASGEMTEAYGERLKALFTEYVDNAQPAAEEPDGKGGARGAAVYPRSEAATTLAASGAGGRLTAPVVAAGEIMFPWLSDALSGAAQRIVQGNRPEGPTASAAATPQRVDVRQDEQPVYEELMKRIGGGTLQGEDAQAADLYKQLLEAPGRLAEDDIELWTTIQDFLRAFEEPQVRQFNVRPLP